MNAPFLLQAPELPWLRLPLLAVPLLLCFLVLRAHRLRESRRLLIGAARASVQLIAVGFVLRPLFGLGISGWTPILLAAMGGAAAVMSLGVLRKGPGPRLLPLAALAILPVQLGLVLPAIALFLPTIHAFDVRYVLGLGGMLAGSAMNAVALAGERFLDGLEQRRGVVELAFTHGARGTEAGRPLARDALRAAVTPSLNGLAAVGLVSLPGMMTGQIMAGADPLLAARYQLMVMIVWTASATLAPALFLLLLGRAHLGRDRAAHGPSGLEGRAIFQPERAAPPPADGPLIYEERPEGGPTTFGG